MSWITSRCRDAAARGSARPAVSRATGFAIEIRERYRMLLGIVGLPPPSPQPDELLSSWLHRLAIANGVAPRAFAGVLGLGGGMWSPRLDVRLPHELAAWLGVRTGVPPEAISAMAMTEGALAPLLVAVARDRACRSRSTWLQFCALALPTIALPIFGDRWRLASRVSCFRHGCGLRDRCPACRGGMAPFAQTDLIPHYVCARCGFDLRGAARISVEAAARRLERSIDDFCKAEIAKRSPAIHEWVARLLRVPVVGRRRLRSAARQPVGVGAHPLLRAARAKGRRGRRRRCGSQPSVGDVEWPGPQEAVTG